MVAEANGKNDAILCDMKIIGCQSAAYYFLPQDYAADVYHKVRLEAGALHLAKYLIRVAVYILSAKVDKICDLQNFSDRFFPFLLLSLSLVRWNRWT